jgi:hypothetical protein
VRRGRLRPIDHETAEAALYARALRIGLAGNAVAGFFLSQAYSYCLFMIVAICVALVRIAPSGPSVGMPAPGPVRPGADV